jgi:hypothetical protein
MLQTMSYLVRPVVVLFLMIVVGIVSSIPMARLANAQQTSDGGWQEVGQEAVIPQDTIVTTELSADDGSFETAIGLSFGGTTGAVNRLTPPSYPATLKEVKIFFQPIQISGVPVGDSIQVMSATNPGGGDDVSSLVFNAMNATVGALGQFNVYDVPDITITSGDFIVGFAITHRAGQFPIALDGTQPLNRRSYVATSGLPYTHIENANFSLVGNFGIRAKVDLIQTCSYTVSSTNLSFDRAGGNGSFTVATSLSDCSWTATTAASWITITPGNGTGAGTAAFTVAANSGTDRAASLTIAGQVFTVTQAGFPLPVIQNVFIQGKKLFVVGQNFDVGASILVNNSPVKKVSNDPDNLTTVLIAKKAGRDILPGTMVTVQVRNANGLLSQEYVFTRSL